MGDLVLTSNLNLLAQALNGLIRAPHGLIRAPLLKDTNAVNGGHKNSDNDHRYGFDSVRRHNAIRQTADNKWRDGRQQSKDATKNLEHATAAKSQSAPSYGRSPLVCPARNYSFRLEKTLTRANLPQVAPRAARPLAPANPSFASCRLECRHMPSPDPPPAAPDATAPAFHPLVADWFGATFEAPTDAQTAAWPVIRSGRDTLVAAPTGSGKTLAAFLIGIDQLIRRGEDQELDPVTRIVYVSPLKALGHDIERNLQAPLAAIRELAESRGEALPEIRVGVRTGDTKPSRRRTLVTRPPHILITTPESFYLMLTSQRARETLRCVDTVIVDEIHALARDRRGSHLALSLERLNHISHSRPQRVGLSATQRPIEALAAFLTGSDEAGNARSCVTVDLGHQRDLDLGIETPPSDLEAVAPREQWDDIYNRLADLIVQHHTTLVFVNTRALAERVSHNLRDRLGEEGVASHHGSLSRERRLHVEQQLKDGQLKALVATASLELGIDIGSIDLVCQIGSPRSIAVFLQRIGRSGHALGLRPKGRLFPTTRDELVESAALMRTVRAGELDRIVQLVAPLDVLAQQIVAEAACEDWVAG